MHIRCKRFSFEPRYWRHKHLCTKAAWHLFNNWLNYIRWFISESTCEQQQQYKKNMKCHWEKERSFLRKYIALREKPYRFARFTWVVHLNCISLLRALHPMLAIAIQWASTEMVAWVIIAINVDQWRLQSRLWLPQLWLIDCNLVDFFDHFFFIQFVRPVYQIYPS